MKIQRKNRRFVRQVRNRRNGLGSTTQRSWSFKDLVAIVFSTIALTFSVVNFVQQQIDRSVKSAEDIPLVGFNYEFPDTSSEYGFYIENKGKKRAHIKFIELMRANEQYKGEAQNILNEIGFSENEYYIPKFGPNFSMPPKSKYRFYTFTKKLDKNQKDLFYLYSTKIKAEICYCDSSESYCSIHIISVDRKVIERGSESLKQCS